ncbi:uncharacterized protein K452DRAFT_311597 [Aplosporella prunicola CBS 121167]|uniref:Uncharacterized protein n=1 Tax=Aplosporella prunicola CBS 121167 TaxID=1176127 RepID=A0A6A6B221_9PEZI|nr:uncharacterized protein K452DRAFT_311597 [Aplosporella prunicola CBS 121167]KAF2138229.1 hypothetical protein K452DRAFT_311597 [Aplosporella prunicola CBS 121167]
MKFLGNLLAAASLIAYAVASPTPDAEAAAEAEAEGGTVRLAKRAEGIHLVNCYGSGTFSYSTVVYCSNDSNCNRYPNGNDRCNPNNNNIVTWEGRSQSCTFGTNVAFSWNINANAQQQANYARVGSGSNNFRSFSVFKDDQHVMYSDLDGRQCRSIYYAL